MVSQAFSEQKLNISEATCKAGDDGRSCNTFTFQVSDVNELRSLMASLARIKGVVQVERV